MTTGYLVCDLKELKEGRFVNFLLFFYYVVGSVSGLVGEELRPLTPEF